MSSWCIAYVPRHEWWLVFNTRTHVIAFTGLGEEEAKRACELLSDIKSVKVKSVKEKEPQFDFTPIYATFPRKKGKITGIQWLLKNVKTEKMFSDIMRACSNYADHCRFHKVDEVYIKHFDSWLRQYENWLPENQEQNQQPRATPQQTSLSNFFQDDK